ncbi:RNA polymerase sigma factor [Winogradskyella flava]|uniref:Sigma-70 family RNA polymerase sigma factor n=1 Tax=Winogradskyella flava TaxID=1884876 RepID=A0A842IUB4_9FLAO|nr:sigma-70 family RNA polymerase sigma factor [Winogradskyella flava]MBC2845323.1 sigma-70 family RNA polymerase sigma factor [Winogradskyella flava]
MERPELIKACKNNNLKAQMQVYQMYKDMLYNVSLRIIINQQDAQDMVHDAFIKAFQNITKLENDLNLGPWLKRIVVNCSLDFLRKKKKLSWLQESYELQQDEEVLTEELDNTSLKFEDVKKAIDALKDKYRIIIVLYLIEDYSHKEIAQQLGLKESTVRNQYVRGKRLLKQQLQNKITV